MQVSIPKVKISSGKGLDRLVHGCVVTFRYVFFFQWVVTIARWLITTGGNIAESAFLVATVYVTVNTVAHMLVVWLLPANVIVTLNQVSVIAFSVLPELIIFVAIKTTFDHYQLAVSTKRVDAWAWAVAYTLPTLVFLYLTIMTISSFVSVEATSVTGAAPLATGSMLVTRCLAGWSYGMLQMLYEKLGNEGYSHLFNKLRTDIVNLTDLLSLRDAAIADLEEERTGLRSELGKLTNILKVRDGDLGGIQIENTHLGRTLKNREDLIVTLQAELEELKEQNATLDAELIDTRIALANSKQNKQSDNGNDDVSSILPVVNTEKYQIVKQHFEMAFSSGEKVNMRKIAADTGIHYNTVRNYARSAIDELARVHSQAK